MIRDFVTAGLIRDGSGRAPGAETTPVPQDNEVVVFRDLFTAGLRFPLDLWFPLGQVVIDILLKYGMFLHHLTPNGVLRLSIYMWVCKSMGVMPNVDNFLRAHVIHHQPKYIEMIGENGALIKEEAQFGCLNFRYKTEGSTPVTLYKNRWEDDWNCFWFNHTIKVDSTSGTHPLVCKEFKDIPNDMSCETEDKDSSRLFMVAFCELVKSYGTRDLVEEYCAVKIFPIKAGWSIVAWKDFGSPIKIPDFARSFNLKKDGKRTPSFFFSSFLLSLLLCADIDVKEVEERANIILGPESTKEYNEVEKRLDGSRSNRVFFFGIQSGTREATLVRKENALKRALPPGSSQEAKQT
ncbi:hypothetical protein SEVIR_3G365901v4 [Setaria viridis]